MSKSPLVALLVGFLLAVSACGSSDDTAETTTTQAADSAAPEPSTTTTTDASPATTAGDNPVAEGFPVDIGGVTIENAPERIVSLNPGATEALFAIGAGDQVAAADSFSTYPPEAPTTDLSAFEPSLEAISTFSPDLVLLFSDPGELVSGLAEIGVPAIVLSSPGDLEAAYAQIADLGVITGQIDGAASVVAEMRERIAAAAESVEASETPIRVFHELDDTFYSVSSNSFVGDVYAQFGLENVADPADPDGYGFPQVAAEFIIEANPDLIVITDQVGYTVDDVKARPGFDTVNAVQNDTVIQVNADAASRPGPRVADFAETVAEILNRIAVPA